MKLLPSLVFGSTIASHFRGATWLTEVNDNGDLQLIFPQTWRRGMAGFPGKFQNIWDCTKKYCSNKSKFLNCL